MNYIKYTLLAVLTFITAVIVACTKPEEPTIQQVYTVIIPTATPTDGPSLDYLDRTRNGLTSPSWACSHQIGDNIRVYWEDATLPPENEDGFEVFLFDSYGEISLPADVNYLDFGINELPPLLKIFPFKLTITEESNLGVENGEIVDLQIKPCDDSHNVDGQTTALASTKQSKLGYYLEDDWDEVLHYSNPISQVCALEYPLEGYPNAVALFWDELNNYPYQETYVSVYADYFHPQNSESQEKPFDDYFVDENYVYPENNSIDFDEYEFEFRKWTVTLDYDHVILLDGLANLSTLQIDPIYLFRSEDEWSFSGTKAINWYETMQKPIKKCAKTLNAQIPIRNLVDGSYNYEDIISVKPLPVDHVCFSGGETISFYDFNYYPYYPTGYLLSTGLTTGEIISEEITPWKSNEGFYFEGIPDDLVKLTIQPFFVASAETSPKKVPFFVYADEIWIEKDDMIACKP